MIDNGGVEFWSPANTFYINVQRFKTFEEESDLLRKSFLKNV